MQGVAIIVAVKTKKSNRELSEVMHGEIWGDRDTKHEVLSQENLLGNLFKKIDIIPPRYAFVPNDWSSFEGYKRGFSVSELFSPYGRPAPGIVTTHDQFAISWTREEAAKKVRTLLASSSESEARRHFRLCTQSQWDYQTAKDELALQNWESQIVPIAYRPFDERYTIYNSHVTVHRRERASKHMLAGCNIALLTSKSHRDNKFAHAFISKTIAEVIGLSPRTGSNAMIFPLYLYPSDGGLHGTERQINFNPEIYDNLQKLADHFKYGVPDEVNVFDYVYGALYCPSYREKYAEFLRSDFPRIPWPSSPDEFWHVSHKGAALRELHLMDSEVVGLALYPFEGDGDNVVSAIGKNSYRSGRVWVNKNQYFRDVPEAAWNFYIGGYQPAQKWLKDRKGRALNYDDVRYYQNIIKVLTETARIMSEIEMHLG